MARHRRHHRALNAQLADLARSGCHHKSKRSPTAIAMRRRREDEDGPPPPGMRIVCVGGNEFEIPDDGRPFTLQGAQLRGANPLKRPAPRGDDVFDASDGRPLKQAAGQRADPRSLARQAADIRATRGASARPSSVEEAETRRADLATNGRELESQSRALQTQANYSTATTWWAKFTAFILFPVQILVFDEGCAEARAAVCDLCRQFLTFTHRCIGQHFGRQDPADPNSSSRYWSQIVTLHRELPTSIDLSFTKGTASRWLAGAQRVRTETFGARPKKKKAMFSIQHIRDLYDGLWTSVGGKRNPTRRRLVLRAAPQLAIQVLFRASEYLRGREGFKHTVHLSRAHATYFTWDWQEIPTEELTPSRLRALLSSGRARALIRMPRLKNDQFLTREFPPTALELNTGPICALRHLLLMEIDDPITTESGRQQAPMFVDPDTGLGSHQDRPRERHEHAHIRHPDDQVWPQDHHGGDPQTVVAPLVPNHGPKPPARGRSPGVADPPSRSVAIELRPALRPRQPRGAILPLQRHVRSHLAPRDAPHGPGHVDVPVPDPDPPPEPQRTP